MMSSMKDVQVDKAKFDALLRKMVTMQPIPSSDLVMGKSDKLATNRVDLRGFTRETAHALGPARHYQIGQRHVFGGERLGNL